MTIRDAYETSGRYLRTVGGIDAAEAHVRARLLVDHLAKVRYAHLVQPARELHPDDEVRLQETLHRLARGYPLPYVMGRCEFFGLSFHCDERALIPRAETETLVEAAVARLGVAGNTRVADLGTGTGCIAVSIAHAVPEATVYTTDVQSAALDLARENAVRHGVAARVHCIPGDAADWAAPLLHIGAGSFTAVLSNPPYIARDEIARLQPEIRDWEPRAALDGGVDGLDCYRCIAAQCGVLLQPDGFLMVELGAGQYEPVRDIFTAEGWSVAPPLFDLAGIARVLTAEQG